MTSKSFVELKQYVDIIKYSTYVCSMCKNIIFPNLEFNDGEISVNVDYTNIRGGKYNEILIRRVCRKCCNRLGDC